MRAALVAAACCSAANGALLTQKNLVDEPPNLVIKEFTDSVARYYFEGKGIFGTGARALDRPNDTPHNVML